MFFAVFVFFVVVFLVNLVGLFLAILCFDCVFFNVLHFLLESTFSVEAGVRLQGQMNRILCVSNQIYAGPHPIMINPKMYSKEG